MPPKLKASSTKWLRPTMLYRVECWSIKSSHIQKIKGRSGLDRGKNAGSETEIIRTCEEEMHGCAGSEVYRKQPLYLPRPHLWDYTGYVVVHVLHSLVWCKHPAQ
ncbi:hypothetical protein H5410_044712, partial [Solanum commersonii]